MATLVYRCPHCGASHDIGEALMGDRVDCRKCGRPFEAAVPVAKPVEAGAEERPEFRIAAGEGDVEETLLTTHPVMARKHPMRFLLAWLAVAAGLAGVGVGLAGELVAGTVGLAVAAAGGLLAAAALAYLVLWKLRLRATTLTVTDKRTILRRGFFDKATTEVRHADVRNLQVDQRWVERMLGVGDVALSSAGQDDLEIRVEGIPNPNRVADVIRDMQ